MSLKDKNRKAEKGKTMKNKHKITGAAATALAVAKARKERLAAMKKALLSKDDTEALAIAREICGLEPGEVRADA